MTRRAPIVPGAAVDERRHARDPMRGVTRHVGDAHAFRDSCSGVHARDRRESCRALRGGPTARGRDSRESRATRRNRPRSPIHSARERECRQARRRPMPRPARARPCRQECATPPGSDTPRMALGRGKRARSTTCTSTPARASANATDDPAGPAADDQHFCTAHSELYRAKQAARRPPGCRADEIHDIVVDPGHATQRTRRGAAIVHCSFGFTFARVAPPPRLHRCAEDGVDEALRRARQRSPAAATRTGQSNASASAGHQRRRPRRRQGYQSA